MVKLSTIKSKCFGDLNGGCKALTSDCIGRDNCPFYKPEGCEDWVRVEIKGEVWLVPPEEYYDEKEMRLLRKRVRRV